MKKNYFFIATLGLSAFLLSFTWKNNSALETYYRNSHKNEAGAPAGRTGAPGEQNCTACHSGSVQADNGFNSITIEDGNGVVTDYTPGSTYTVTVAMSTTNVKNGFEITAFDPANAMAGTFTVTDATNTKQVGTAKKYITHKLAGTALNTWSFNWTAPATNVGDVTFYLATNETNANSGSGGDVIRLTQFPIGSTASLKENTDKYEVNVGFNPTTNGLQVVMESRITGEASINIVDLNGKSVQFEQLGDVAKGKNGYSVLLKNNLPAGTYIANIAVNNNFVTKKFVIQ